MAKKKVETTQKVSSIWDQIVDSVNKENKEGILEELKSQLEYLEKTNGDKDLITGFKATIKRIG